MANKKKGPKPSPDNVLRAGGGGQDSHVRKARNAPPNREDESARRQDPYRELGDDSRKPSPEEAAQRARDEASVAPEASHPGNDEGSPRQIPEDTPTP